MPNEESASKEEILKDLKNIPSIGNLTARSLIEADYDSISKLKEADVEDLTSIDYIGENLANKIVEEIKKGSLDDQEKEENITLEFRCPVCNRFTWSEGDKCQECEEPVKLFSSVVLPEKGIIKDPKKTLAEVEDKILNDGGDAESWFIRGSILESMGANRKALESFDRVIELDPLFDYVWNAKAQVSLKIGETEEAAKAYKLAFDTRKAPKDIADQIEKVKKSTSKDTIELKEKDEVDKELDEKISKARDLLGKLVGGEKDVSKLIAILDTVTEERIRGNKEKSLDMVKDVIKRCQSFSDAESEIKKIEEKDQIEDKAEAKLSEARKKLSKLRETNFDLDNMKRLLKNSNECRKKGELQKSITLTEKFIKSSDKIIDLSELIEKTDKKIKELDEKDLIDKERINHEIGQYKKLVKVEKYDLAKRFLSKTLEELKEALDKEKMIPPPEEKLDKTATQIPTQIKEKVRNVKELNNLVEKAEIEIKVNRKPLKDAIIKIKDLEYLEANKILTNWKKSLIDRLDYEMGDRLKKLHGKLDELDIPSVQRRGKAILENVERKWNLKAYEGALKALIYASSFIQNIQEKKTKKDKQIYLSSELIEDIQGSGNSTKDIEELLNKVRENREKEKVFKKTLEEIKEKIGQHLKDAMDNEIENLEERLEGLTRKKIIVAINNLIDLKSSLDEENIEKASWYMREYKNVIEEG